MKAKRFGQPALGLGQPAHPDGLAEASTGVADTPVQPPKGPTGATARRQELLHERQLQRESAVPEGGDVLEGAQVPVALCAVHERTDLFLRENYGHALIATEDERANALATRTFTIFEVELREGGKVKQIDLVRRARELKILEPCESPLNFWYRVPRYARAAILPG
jgi:hypothetical protein